MIFYFMLPCSVMFTVIIINNNITISIISISHKYSYLHCQYFSMHMYLSSATRARRQTIARAGVDYPLRVTACHVFFESRALNMWHVCETHSGETSYRSHNFDDAMSGGGDDLRKISTLCNVVFPPCFLFSIPPYEAGSSIVALRVLYIDVVVAALH